MLLRTQVGDLIYPDLGFRIWVLGMEYWSVMGK